MEPDATELRVVACLVEKQRTTPDAYPLSVNALRLACNQSTNRDPVVAFDEETVREALARLRRRGWARLAGAARAAKYRHLLGEALGLADDELALVTVLALRGAQTPGELHSRAARLHAFAGLGAVEETLERLLSRELAAPLERRPGQKEVRWEQRLGATSTPPDSPNVAGPGPEAGASAVRGGGEGGGAGAGGAARRGVDHLDLVVSDLERSLRFYRGLLQPLGYDRVSEIVGERGERVVYVTSATNLVPVSLRQAPSSPVAPYDRYSLGLHHLAFAAASREQVDDRAAWARDAGAPLDGGPREYDYAPGYYAVFLFDPDGLKLEVVHRPGAAGTGST